MFNFMVVQYILDKGIEFIKSLTDEDVEEAVELGKEREKTLKGTNKHPVMTIEFQKEIIETARFICSQERDQVIRIIQKELKNN